MLDKELNLVPENVKKIHLISACGTGMGALAAMLSESGYEVTGSDKGIYPPMSTFLEEKGISLFKGFQPENIGSDVDLVIVGNAVLKDNPEAIATHKRQLHYLSMPQAINHFFAGDKKVILVTGTHGKTTTTGLISWILESCGYDPSFFIGGIHKNFDSGFKKGDGDFFVIEGDEYDTAFFDKESKFLHFKPHRLVITGIEFDHADIFDSVEDIKRMFKKLFLNLDANSKVFAFDSSEELLSLINSTGIRNLICYGEEKEGIGFRDFRNDPFVKYLYYDQEAEKEISLPMSGKHNLYNSLAAIGVCRSIGIEFNDIADALKTYKGMKRRQELVGEVNGIKVIDDFAHHPTEVKLTISGIRSSYRPKRLISVFEPRTNTSMRNHFQESYTNSFSDSDMVLIMKPSRLDKVPEKERFSSETLVQNLNKKEILSYSFENTDAIIEFLMENAIEEDLILVMSNGGFDNIHQRLIKGFKGMCKKSVNDKE